MAQFTSYAGECSHMSSSGRTKNCRAGCRQWALHAAIPVLHHILGWEQCQCQVSLQQLCSTSRTIWETSCCSHSIILTPQEQLHPESPWELAPNTAGWAQDSQGCIWAPSQANLCAVSQRSAEERSVREFSPQPSIEFPTRQSRKTEKY